MSAARVRRVRSLPGVPLPRRPVTAATLAATMDTVVAVEPGSLPPVPRRGDDDKGAQAFVARLRGAAALFAAAAGAQTAVVREAVPPARHRRSRCRVVLRFADGGEVDLSFLGPAGSARRAAGFGAAVQRWLAADGPRDPAWLVPDADAADGVAVDVAAWMAAG